MRTADAKTREQRRRYIMQPHQTLETTDLFKGAFLLCMGGALKNVRVEFNGRQTATFLFTGRGLARHDDDYIEGRALVNPVQMKNSLNHLRDVLFNTLRERENTRNDRSNYNQYRQNRR